MTTGSRSLPQSLYPSRSSVSSTHKAVQVNYSAPSSGSSQSGLAAQRPELDKNKTHFIATYRDWPIWLVHVRIKRQTGFGKKYPVLQWQHPADQGKAKLRYTYQIRPRESLNQALEIVRIMIDQTLAIAQQHEP
jgi:hypothetical protein